MQILIPLVMTIGIFGGEPMTLVNSSGTLLGKIPSGTETYIHNAGFLWLVFLVPLAFLGWFGMNNIVTESVTPKPGNPAVSMVKIFLLLLIALFTASMGLYLLLPPPTGLGLLSKWIVLPLVIAATLLLLRYLTRGELQANLKRQFQIFGNKHTWAMTGFTHVAGPDGVLVHTVANLNGPSALMYAWIGPFVGALIRPLGGWISDRVGGAKVTQIVSIVMIASALGVAYYMSAAYRSATPEEFFWPFFILFVILFAATGVGNGSTFRTIAVVFNQEQTGPVLGWTSAVAAYGAFIIPKVFGEQIKLTTPEYALYGFAVFYGICVLVNWWFYLRPNAYVKNP
jgi:NNP family nitrate/nitrite transporter-like MFS transporter